MKSVLAFGLIVLGTQAGFATSLRSVKISCESVPVVYTPDDVWFYHLEAKSSGGRTLYIVEDKFVDVATGYFVLGNWNRDVQGKLSPDHATLVFDVSAGPAGSPPPIVKGKTFISFPLDFLSRKQFFGIFKERVSLPGEKERFKQVPLKCHVNL